MLPGIHTAATTRGAAPRRLRLALALALVLATLALLVPAGAAQAQGPLPGAFTPGPCPFPAIQGARIDCGTLTVAESRRNPTNKTIQLAVAVLRSSNPSPAPDPAFFLAGGPGQATLALAPLLLEAYAPVLARRDLVLFDQRGTGFSQPALTCDFGGTTTGALHGPGLVIADERAVEVQVVADALADCGRRYRAAGIDLSAYNSVENAADIEDLRRALGAEQINLIGGSYGTRLALTAMRYRPETLRSVVLDSVYPLQENFHTGAFASYRQSLERLFAACAADAACNGAYPNLGQLYDDMVARLNAAPPALPITNLKTNQVIDYLPLDGNTASVILFQLFYGTGAIPVLPVLIGETAQGNYRPFASILSALLSGGGASPIAIGMQTAVQCNEDATFADQRDFITARDKNRRAAPLAYSIVFNDAYLDVCAAFGLSARPAGAENSAVRIDLPTLIIGGEFDPITPPQNAAIAAETLPNSFTVIYPRGGHTPSASSPCLAGAVAAFLDAPNQRPDTSCLAREAPLPFVTPR